MYVRYIACERNQFRLNLRPSSGCTVCARMHSCLQFSFVRMTFSYGFDSFSMMQIEVQTFRSRMKHPNIHAKDKYFFHEKGTPIRSELCKLV